MPLYRYQALNQKGKKTSGVINADCIEMAKERLKKERVVVTRLTGDNGDRSFIKLSSASLLAFTRDIANLLQSGLPLYESLLIIEEKATGDKDHHLFLTLCDAVKQGSQLSEALAQYPKSFDSIYVAMVAAGEETGSLPNVFFQLTKIIAKQQKLRKQIATALIYPAFLFTFCIIVILALFLFVIPSMRELMEGRKLHPLTQTVLSMSQYLSSHKTIFAAIFSLSSLTLIFFSRSKNGKAFFKNIYLHIPLLKKMLSWAVLIRFTRTLGILLSHSVPLTSALKLAKKVMDHPQYEAVVTIAEQKIIEGKKLSLELGESKLFPSMMIRMLSTAEEVGKIDEMLIHIAEIYEEDLEKSLQQFTTLLQPIMLLILGLIVGVVLLSVLLPLTDVSSFL
jgi:general secretion pathway protein F/type IV pilus assembly protein PilC